MKGVKYSLLIILIWIVACKNNAKEKKRVSEPIPSSEAFHGTLVKEPKFNFGKNIAFSDSLASSDSYPEAVFSDEKWAQDWNFWKELMQDFGGNASERQQTMSHECSFVNVAKGIHSRDITRVMHSPNRVEGGFVNTLFLGFDGEQNDVLSLLGTNPARWACPEFAPHSVDYVSEYDLKVVHLLRYFTSLVQEMDLGILDGITNESKYVREESFKSFKHSENVQIRVSEIVRIDSRSDLKIYDGIGNPSIKFAYLIHGQVSFIKRVLRDLDADYIKTSMGARTYYKFKNKGKSRQVDLRDHNPVLVLDEMNGIVFLSNSEEFLQECFSNGAKLKDEKFFKKSIHGLNNKGNLFIYGSHKLFSKFRVLTKDFQRLKVPKTFVNKGERHLFETRIDFLNMLGSDFFPSFSGSMNGFAATMCFCKNGILFESKFQDLRSNCAIVSKFFLVSLMNMMSYSRNLPNFRMFRAGITAMNGKKIHSSIQAYAAANGDKAPEDDGNGMSANSCLRKLFDEGFIDRERLFYITGIDGLVAPDEKIKQGNALSSGENMFAYVPNAHMLDEKAHRPLLMAPFSNNGSGWKLDPKAFAGKIVVVFLDGSVQLCTYNEEENVLVDGNGELLYKDEDVHYRGLHDKYLAKQVLLPE